MIDKIKIKVFAKINLSLNILGSELNMHSLDMVMTSVDIADVISVERSKNRQNTVTFFPLNLPIGKDNSVTKALHEIGQIFDDVFVDVKVIKGIPFCGGLGGSSADAAGVIYAVDKIFDLKKRGFKPALTALKVGSDVPYMLRGGFARVLSSGIDIVFEDFFKTICLVICQGKNGVSTAESYKKFDEIYSEKRLIKSDNDKLLSTLKNGKNFDFLEFIDNALFEGSAIIEPSILNTIDALNSVGALKSFMTGSGSACVGVFESLEKAALAEATLKELGYYANACTTVPSGIVEIE